MTEQESTCLTEKPLTVEELKELLNHEDLYELLRKSLTPEEQAYIDKIQIDAIYKDT